MVANIHAAKTRLPRRVERAGAGEAIVLARAGKPVARLVAADIDPPPLVPGALAGRIRIAEDFDETPDWMLAAFKGGER